MPIIAWQGLHFSPPTRWNPVKLEGDFDKGHILLADLHRPRLGIRWNRITKKKFDPAPYVKKAMRGEVGSLAADEAVDYPLPGDAWDASTLYIEPHPPGRDVWMGFSKLSRRIVQVIHHAHRRERILQTSILPTLHDTPADQPLDWSIFDLSCRVERRLPLADQRLLAGDLSLIFRNRKATATIRQIAVARLALQRQSLEQWLASQQRAERKYYKPRGESAAVRIKLDDSEVPGLRRLLRRRARFAWRLGTARELTTYALHDESHDRLVIAQASDDKLAREILATVGLYSKP